MDDIPRNTEEALKMMRGFIERIEEQEGAVVADFYRAHYEGCVRMHEMGNKWKTLPNGPEKDKMMREMNELEWSLRQTLPMLQNRN